MNDIQHANRKAVIGALLNALEPTGRFLLLRTPQFKQRFLGHNRTITDQDRHARSINFRIGFHNDAFLADDSDMGKSIIIIILVIIWNWKNKINKKNY